MKRTFAFVLFSMAILLTFCIRGYYKITRADDTVNRFSGWLAQFDDGYSGIQIPDEMNFAGEQVPLHDLQTRGRYAKEFLSNTYILLPSIFKDPVRVKVFKDIKLIIKQEGIPEDFIYLVMAESQLLNKVSPKGAAGIWQIMPASAIGLGLEVNEFIDERFDYIKATYAACRYLKQAHKELGSWTLAAASYNMGIGGISRKISLSGTDDYYALPLNKETTSYLYRILIIKYIMTTEKIRFASEFIVNTIQVDSSWSSLEDFCAATGCDYFVLKQFNPWLVGNQLPVQGKSYKIVMPLNYYAPIAEKNIGTVNDSPIGIRIQNRLLKLFN